MNARIGIDLGTTNSLAAIVSDMGPQVIGAHLPNPCVMPSVVSFEVGKKDGVTKVGVEADRELSHRRIRSIKRLMGRTYETAVAEGAAIHFDWSLIQRGYGNDLLLKIGNADNGYRDYRPHDISAMILKSLFEKASRTLGAPIEGAVITVPAYFGDTHRAATLMAARDAGISVIEPLLDEPTAAALAFGRLVGLASGEPLLVVDWGGGTLDITVLIKDAVQWVQLKIDGDLNLGGDDIDNELLEMILTAKNLPEDIRNDPQNIDLLRRDTQLAKHVLSSGSEATIPPRLLTSETGQRILFTAKVKREEAEGCMSPLIERAMDIVTRTIQDPSVPLQDIKKVLLVGGSTKIPLFRRRLAEVLPGRAFHDEVDPMQAVSLGAALYASMQRPEVFRICPYGYAIESGKQAFTVIPPGQEIPTPVEMPFEIIPKPRTTYDGQTVFRLRLFPITDSSKGLRSLTTLHAARIFAQDFSPSPAGTPIKIELWLDQNKEVRARAYSPGCKGPKDLDVSMVELGEKALRTDLTDRILESEAYIEANKGKSIEWLKELKSSLALASSTLDSNDHKQYAKCHENLNNLLELIHLPRPQFSQSEDEETRDRVRGWALFLEQNLLPTFWKMIEPEIRDSAIQEITRIRIMLQTGAGTNELEKRFSELWDRLHGSKNSIVISGYLSANSQGTSESMSKELDDLCFQSVAALQRQDHAAYQRICTMIAQKTQVATKGRRLWKQSEGIEHVNPDLIVITPDEEQ